MSFRSVSREASPGRSRRSCATSSALLAPKSDAEFEALAQRSQLLTRAELRPHDAACSRRSTSRTNASTTAATAGSRAIIRSCASRSISSRSSRKRAISRREGFRQVLLVAGEHPKFVSGNYLADCVRALATGFLIDRDRSRPDGDARNISRSSQPARRRWSFIRKRTTGSIYAEMHTSGPKRDFDWRLDCPERGYDAGLPPHRHRRALRARAVAATKRSRSPRMSITC